MSQTTTPPNAPEVDVLSPPPECGNCGSHSLSWDISQRNTSSVVEGRLRTGDVESICVLGCDDCSETIMVVPTSAAIRALLTREAALVARNAELEKQLCETTQIANAVIIERNSFRDACLQRVAERDALKDERDQLNSDYLTAINAAKVIAAERDALTAEVAELKAQILAVSETCQSWDREARANGFRGGDAKSVQLHAVVTHAIACTRYTARTEAGHG